MRRRILVGACLLALVAAGWASRTSHSTVPRPDGRGTSVLARTCPQPPIPTVGTAEEALRTARRAVARRQPYGANNAVLVNGLVLLRKDLDGEGFPVSPALRREAERRCGRVVARYSWAVGLEDISSRLAGGNEWTMYVVKTSRGWKSY